MGDGDAGVGGGGDARGDAGDDLELDPGRAQRFALLAAATEDEGVAALEADDALAGLRRLDQPLPDLLLRYRRHAGLLADVDQLGVLAGAVERPGRDQAVVEDRRRRWRSAPASAPSSARDRRARHRPGRRFQPARSNRCSFFSHSENKAQRSHQSTSNFAARSSSSRAPAPSSRSASSAAGDGGLVRVGLDPVAQPLAAVGEADEGVDRRSARPRPGRRRRPGSCSWRRAGAPRRARRSARGRRRGRRRCRPPPPSPRHRRAPAAPASPAPAPGPSSRSGS